MIASGNNSWQWWLVKHTRDLYPLRHDVQQYVSLLLKPKYVFSNEKTKKIVFCNLSLNMNCFWSGLLPLVVLFKISRLFFPVSRLWFLQIGAQLGNMTKESKVHYIFQISKRISQSLKGLLWVNFDGTMMKQKCALSLSASVCIRSHIFEREIKLRGCC